MTEQHKLQALLGTDRYRLERVIGHGGMSTVWLAEDIPHRRWVALKVLRPEFSDNIEFLSRFRNEALASEQIISDNVVKTYDYREVTAPAGHTLCCIAMEFVQGESLADLLEREGALPEEDALNILEQAAAGLAVIHQQGLVHRDIKPGNILITGDGVVKITDFGIAKAAAAVPLTRTGMVVGTAQYVSPEQAQGLNVTSSSDVYSLAVVGYEMLAGQRPFNGDSSVSVAIAHINQAPPQITTGVSDHARELIGIALRKDPARRYATGAEFMQAIGQVRLGNRPPQPVALSARTQTAQPPAATPAPAAEPTTPPAEGNKRLGLLITAGAVALATIAGVIIYMAMSSEDQEPAPTEPPVVSVVTETATVSVTPTEEPSSSTSSSSSSSSSSSTTPSNLVERTVTVTAPAEEPEQPEAVETVVVPAETETAEQVETTEQSAAETTSTASTDEGTTNGGEEAP